MGGGDEEGGVAAGGLDVGVHAAAVAAAAAAAGAAAAALSGAARHLRFELGTGRPEMEMELEALVGFLLAGLRYNGRAARAIYRRDEEEEIGRWR